MQLEIKNKRTTKAQYHSPEHHGLNEASMITKANWLDNYQLGNKSCLIWNWPNRTNN